MTIHNRYARLTLFSAQLALLAMLAPPAFAANPVNGQKLYLAHCVGCHGKEGISTMPQTPNLARVERSFDQPPPTLMDPILIDIVRSGRATMPAFLGILKDGEIRDVISYVDTLPPLPLVPLVPVVPRVLHLPTLLP